jgi:hypothetical protein
MFLRSFHFPAMGKAILEGVGFFPQRGGAGILPRQAKPPPLGSLAAKGKGAAV